MNGRLALYGLLALMVLFWSANFVIAKYALRDFPPLLLSGLRAALAGAFIFPVYRAQSRRAPDPAWDRGDLRLLVYLGLIGGGVNQLTFVLGISLTSVAHASITSALMPILVLLVAVAAGMERLGARKLGGMALAVMGIALLNAFPPARGPQPRLLGDLLVLLSGVAFALFTVLSKRAAARHNPVTVTAFAYLVGALALAPLTIWESAGFPFERVAPAGWAALVYMALFPSVVCYLIYSYALARIPASRAASLSYLQPVLATALGVLFLGEHVTLPLAAGGAIIFSGVYLAERG